MVPTVLCRDEWLLRLESGKRVWLRMAMSSECGHNPHATAKTCKAT
jgi:hypothetical protein